MLKKYRQIILLSLLSFFAFTSVGMAAPASVNYQGRLVDNTTGTALTGTMSLEFRVFDNATGGFLLWSETQSATLDNNGIFQVILGCGITTYGSFEADLFIDDDCWLEIVVAGEIMNSRQKFASVPFALQAEEAINASHLEKYSSAAFVRKSETGIVDSAMVLNNSLTAADMHDGTALAEILDDDGSGSGLDADLLDGHHASFFMSAAADNWVNTTGDTMSGSLTVDDSLWVNHHLYVGTDNASDDDFIYFDGSSSSEYLKWDESGTTFYLSDNLSIANTLQASVSSTDIPTAYNRFGNGTTNHTGAMASGSDLLITDDLEVNGDIYADNGLRVGTDNAADNDFIYFDSGTSESLQWNNSAAEFQLSDDLKVAGEYRYAAPKTYYYQIPALEFHHNGAANQAHYKATFGGGGPDNMSGAAKAIAPVHLPIGATITSVRFYFCDNDSAARFEICKGMLVRRTPSSQDPQALAEVLTSSTDSFASASSFSIADSSIDYAVVSGSYQYAVYIYISLSPFSDLLTFQGCRITYTIDKVAP